MTPSNFLRVALLAGVASLSPLRAGNGEFKQLVRALEAQCHQAPIGTGFLGVLARCFSPSGVSGLHMAIFDEMDPNHRILGANFERLVQESIGTDRVPMVRVSSSRTGERTLIYAKPQGRMTELLIVTSDPHDVVVVSLSVDARTLQAWLDDPGHMDQEAKGGRRSKHESDTETREANPA